MWFFEGRLRKDGAKLKENQAPAFLKGKWCRSCALGYIAWLAAFLVPSKQLVSELRTLANFGERLIANLPLMYNISSVFDDIKDQHSVALPIELFKFLVARVAHVYRHQDTLVYAFLSLRLSSRLVAR